MLPPAVNAVAESRKKPMNTNWKLVAEGKGVPLADEEVKKLSALEALFRPQTAAIPMEVEPAIILSEEAVDPR